jgi:hypothetical protein
MTYSYIKNAEGHYICPHCSVVKKNQNTMHYHLKGHETRLPYECHFCKKGFLHASTLELHKRSQHSKENEKLMKCNIPGCSFAGTLTKANLLIHFIRKHCAEEAQAALEVTDESYRCKICNKNTKSLTAFHYHIMYCIHIDDSVRRERLKELQA